ncbi:MAG: ABC transporter ATP-binding protein [Candidatus Moranbacteria bacterium]|nr:ABC transporter ATP-binding protein [Candidatus Moranbacteria bacterium]
MKTKLIKTKNLCKTYYSGEVKTRAVCGVNLEIGRGEFAAIVGPSGSGKSTLMQMLGFLERPTAGEYLFKGKNASNYKDDELAQIRNKEVGFVFQTFNLLPRTTVYENVELPLLYSDENKNGKNNKEKITRALKAVGLEHRIDYYSNQISGGQKQRVAIARALINDPDLIFADEPTGNLDSKSGEVVMDILKKLNKKGKTIILVTHEEELLPYAKRVVRMRDGRIEKDQVI